MIKIIKYQITGVKCSTICRNEDNMFVGSMWCRDECKHNEGTNHKKYQIVCSHPNLKEDSNGVN